MARIIAVMWMLLSTPVIFSDILYVTGSGTVEVYSRYNIFKDHISAGYEQSVTEVDGNYLVRITSRITKENLPRARFRMKPSKNYSDSHIIGLAEEITRGSRYLHEAVEKLVLWVRENISYNSELMTKEPAGFRHILLKKEGTCVDIIYVLSEMFDACGIKHNIIRGLVIDDSSIMLHRWLEFEDSKGCYIPVDPLASLFFITPNYLFIRRDDRYSKAYYDYPIMEKLKEIRILSTEYSFMPIGKKPLENMDIMAASRGNGDNKGGIVIVDKSYIFGEIIVKGRGQTYLLKRDKILTYSVFGLERGRYDIFHIGHEGKRHIKTVFLKDREIHFAGL